MGIFNIFRTVKNKRYNYTPRYYSGKSIDNSFEFDLKLNKYKEVHNKNDFSGNWNRIRMEKRNRKNFSYSILLFLIIVILIFIFLYIIDFDISIFY